MENFLQGISAVGVHLAVATCEEHLHALEDVIIKLEDIGLWLEKQTNKESVIILLYIL